LFASKFTDIVPAAALEATLAITDLQDYNTTVFTFIPSTRFTISTSPSPKRRTMNQHPTPTPRRNGTTCSPPKLSMQLWSNSFAPSRSAVWKAPKACPSASSRSNSVHGTQTPNK
jgi:hypothetical protein